MKFPIFALLVLGSRLGGPDLYTFHHENVLGTSLELKFQAANEQAAAKAESAALAEIDRLNKILSAWDTTSEFSRWTRTHNEAVTVSPELYEVLGLFDKWRTATNGALNAGPSSNAQHWTLSAGKATHLDDAPLKLATFTKSYIASKAANAALSSDVTGAVVNIGGDVVVRGSITEPVYIRDPRADAENDVPIAQLTANNQTVATSGTYRRGTHILDPRTGRAAEDVISATVISKDAVTAGALATAFTILSLEEAKKVVAQLSDTNYLVIRKDGTQYASASWPRVAMALAPATIPEWNSGYELVINLGLARVDDPRYRRPYVAVWIEDKDRFPVRTIALWYEKPRWLPDLKTWYRDDRIRALAEGNEIAGSISSATRPPGRYTLKWNGKDNAGKLVKPGKYTVCIEAAREHGTYQVLRQEMEFNGTPKQAQLPANTELESVSLDYRKSAR